MAMIALEMVDPGIAYSWMLSIPLSKHSVSGINGVYP